MLLCSAAPCTIHVHTTKKPTLSFCQKKKEVTKILLSKRWHSLHLRPQSRDRCQQQPYCTFPHHTVKVLLTFPTMPIGWQLLRVKKHESSSRMGNTHIPSSQDVCT